MSHVETKKKIPNRGIGIGKAQRPTVAHANTHTCYVVYFSSRRLCDCTVARPLFATSSPACFVPNVCVFCFFFLTVTSFPHTHAFFIATLTTTQRTQPCARKPHTHTHAHTHTHT